jgi:hypothetical protein
MLGEAAGEVLATRLAQSFGVALAGSGKVHDLLCENFIGNVAAISKSKR